MKLSELHIIEKNNEATVEIDVRIHHNLKKLHYSVSNLPDFTLVQNYDYAIIALLVPAMLAKEDISIEGSLSKNFHSKLEKIQHILHQWDTNYHFIKIEAKALKEYQADNQKNTVLTGFSGGVDSYATLNKYFFHVKNPKDKVTHLCFNNVGSHNHYQSDLYRNRLLNMQKTVDQYIHLPIIKIISNLDEFYTEEFQKNHVLRNLSVPFLLRNKVTKFYYASGYNDVQSIGAKNNDMSFIEQEIFDLLSENDFQLKIADKKSTRVEKIGQISTLEPTFHSLDVCSNSQQDPNFINCGKCMKCLKTLVALEGLDKLNDYKEVFNLNNYAQNRDFYLSSFINTNDPHKIELIKLLEKKNFKFKPIHYVYKYFHPKNIKSKVYKLIYNSSEIKK